MSSTVALTSVVAIIIFSQKIEAKLRFQAANRNTHSLTPRIHDFSSCAASIDGNRSHPKNFDLYDVLKFDLRTKNMDMTPPLGPFSLVGAKKQ